MKPQSTGNGKLVQRGQDLYDAKFKSKLEPQHNGEYMAIEPDSGHYYLGQTMSEAFDKAHEAHADKQFYLVRVGFEAAVSFKNRTSL